MKNYTLVIASLFMTSMSAGAQVGSETLSVKKMPVRIPRPYFERTLVGHITLYAPDFNLNFSQHTPVSWEESPTTLAPPSAGALADFRDFTGCLKYTNIDGVALCFNVMPDVSSVGVNSKEMTLQGIETFINEELAPDLHANGCKYNVQNIQFKKAERQDGKITIEFSSNMLPEEDCQSNAQPLDIHVDLQAL